jgi:hypothetical protein
MRALLIIAALVLLSVAVWFSFCLSDWRYGHGTCRVHGVAMETALIHPPAGPAPSYEPGYVEARKQQFPNALPDTGPGGGVWWRAGMIYVCPDCTRAREAWMP